MSPFRPVHTLESAAAELSAGLRNGSIQLDSSQGESPEPAAGEHANERNGYAIAAALITGFIAFAGVIAIAVVLALRARDVLTLVLVAAICVGEIAGIYSSYLVGKMANSLYLGRTRSSASLAKHQR